MNFESKKYPPTKYNVFKFNRLLASFLMFGLIFILASCADTVSLEQATMRETVGFWYGLWHGFIAPISFIISLFDKDVAIYAVYNNGGWYDLGFLLGFYFSVIANYKAKTFLRPMKSSI